MLNQSLPNELALLSSNCKMDFEVRKLYNIERVLFVGSLDSPKLHLAFKCFSIWSIAYFEILRSVAPSDTSRECKMYVFYPRCIITLAESNIHFSLVIADIFLDPGSWKLALLFDITFWIMFLSAKIVLGDCKHQIHFGSTCQCLQTEDLSSWWGLLFAYQSRF